MELSGSPSSSNHSVVTAAQPNRTVPADAMRTNPQPLAPAKPRRGNQLRTPLSPASDAVSSTIFLLNMAANFEVQGNFPESVKSAETALLVRKSKNALIEPMLARNPDLTHPPPAPKGRRDASIPASISEQARDLVLRCNSFAVSEFTRQHYDAATFFLDKALFLTDSGSDKTPTDLTRSVQKMLALSATASSTTTENTSLAVAEEVWMSSCFTGVEEERLRLRAATYNNLGCMERRRGRQEPSLDYLRKAIQIEMRLDPSGSASASTYLNLCMVLNEMGKHAEAVVACERAITALQLNMIEEANAPRLARYAKMLAVAQYNLGASVERRDPKGDKAEAENAYRLALSTCHRYHLVDPGCNSVDEAFKTIKHMKKPPQWALLQPQEAPQMLGSPPRQQPRPAEPSPLKLQPLAPSSPPKVASKLRSWEAEVSEATPFSLHSGQHSQHSDGSVPDKHRVAEPRSRPNPPVPAVAQVQSPKSQPPQAALTMLELPSLGSQPQVATPVSGMLWTHPSPSPHSPLAATLEKRGPLPHRSSVGKVSQPHSPHTTPSMVSSQRNSTLSGSLSSLLRPGRAVPQPPPTLDPIPAPSPTSAEVRKSPLLGILPEKLNESYPLTQTYTPFDPTAQIALPIIIASQSVGLANTPPRLSFVSPLKVSTELPHRDSRVHSLSYGSVTPANALGRRTFGSTSGGIVSLSNNKLLPARLASESNASASRLLGSRQATAEQQRKSIAREQRRQERRRREAQKRQDKRIAEANSNLADELYEQMVSGMQQVELRRCQEAAIEIQRMWRGVMARSWIRTMMSAAERLQRVVRKFLVKVREERRLLEEERQRRLAEQRRRELKACRVIQARTRQFLHRLEIRRQYLAHQRRNFMAARAIQRGYRHYCRRRAEVIAAEAKQSRWEDELRRFRQKVAVQRIQMAYRNYRQHLAELAAIEEKQRRDSAATKVQALIRGFLTRAWFTYYRAYTRDQELRSAANQRRIVVIQTACRAVMSAKYCTEVRMQRIIEERQRRLNQAATHIQCMWRQRVAFIKLERLRAEHDRDMRLATVIQRWYRSRKQRKWFLFVCEENRREKAAGKIQRWVRNLWAARKEKEFAAYHMEKLREMRLFRLRQESILVMQACTLAKMSARIVGSMRAAFEKQEATAKEWQRICRGYLARVGLGLQKEATHRLCLHELTLATQTVAARILQRAWRCMKSKMTVEQMRREIAAGTVIARSYRVYRAKCALYELRAAKREKAADGAARCIQLCVRGFLKTRRLQEMEAYYRTEQAKKMVHWRRVEATTMIQSLWRGYVTRKALDGVREEHRGRCLEATRLQRMWRRCKLRRTMQLEMARRVEGRMVKSAAALTIQCFWRKMMSAEYTARLRADRAVLTEKVQALQCWWRQQRAKRLLARLRQAAADEDALAAHYARLWERAATLVNCALRVRQSQLHAQQTLFVSLLNRLSLEKRIRFELRDRAATKIQALYRGYVERIYARGLLREKKYHDRIAAERAARETTAASKIQCAYRRHAARQEVHRRRTARRETALAEEEFIATADSHQIVRELFWANSVLTARDATAERLTRINKLEASARTIQRAVRYWRATTTATARARQMRCERAALCIQNYWRQYLGRKEGLAAQRRQQAAITIQRNARGWLVRREWGAWRTAMASKRHKRVELEDALDHAVIVIQSCWRRVVARRRANALRQERDARKHAQRLEDAAFIIQDAFHGSRRKSCHGVR